MLAQAELDMTQRAFKGRADDDRLLIKFDMYPHLDQAATEKEGRPIYNEREYITIIVPGDKDSVVHRPVWQKDKERFARQYQQFRSNEAQTVSGTLLSMWGGVTISQVKELEYFNIKTVEQLAELNDTFSSNFRGIASLKQKARDYVANAKEQQPLLQMRTELEARDNEIATLKRNMEEMAATMKELKKESKKAA